MNQLISWGFEICKILIKNYGKVYFLFSDETKRLKLIQPLRRQTDGHIIFKNNV